MQELTNECAIAQQLLVEYWEKPMRIPDPFADFGNTIVVAEIDGLDYCVILYQFNYSWDRGMAKGLWLLSDVYPKGKNLRETQLGVRLA